MQPKRVLVVGGGVMGATSALELLQRGYEVTMVAKQYAKRDHSQLITSEIAGALWEYPPSFCGRHVTEIPVERPKRWAMASYRRFYDLSKRSKETGVFWRNAVYYFPEKIEDLPEEMDKFNDVSKLPGFRHSADLIKETGVSPNAYFPMVDAYTHEAPMIDTEVYMQWIYKQIRAKGARLVNREIKGLLKDQVEQLKKTYGADIVVNCTGLGAKDLAADDNVYPIRGIVLNIKNDGVLMPKLEYSITVAFVDWMNADNEEDASNWLVYLIPRGDDRIWVGGIVEPDKTDLNLTLDYKPLRLMLEKAKAFYPPLRALNDDDITEILVGLRPGRHGDIRLEADPSCQSLVHSYGHAGAGWIMSWGSAIDVANLVDKELRVGKFAPSKL